MTTVSAIVPTYNRADSLGRALDSAYGQSRPPDEVIVVDDGSTDGTTAVLDRFPQARVVRLARNGGAARARNEGVRQARGELIAFLDSDDTWYQHKLELQLRRFEGAPDLGLLCTGITVHGSSGGVAHYGAPAQPSSDAWSFEELQTYPFSTPTWMIRRSVFLALGAFDESLPNCEDLDLLARMVGRHRIAFVDAPLVTKYNRTGGLNTGRLATAQSYAILFERHRALWQRAPAAAARAHHRLANMHIDAGDLASGRADLLQALRLQPARPSLWALLLLSLLGRGAYRGARRWRQP